MGGSVLWVTFDLPIRAWRRALSTRIMKALNKIHLSIKGQSPRPVLHSICRRLRGRDTTTLEAVVE